MVSKLSSVFSSGRKFLTKRGHVWDVSYLAIFVCRLDNMPQYFQYSESRGKELSNEVHIKENGPVVVEKEPEQVDQSE